MPNRKLVSTRVHDLFAHERQKIVQLLTRAKYVALTADYWTSAANDSYLGVTAHFIDEDWTLHSFALGCQCTEERHYSEVCAEHFKAVADEWNIFAKVTTFGTDNARNMTAAVALLPSFEHMPCIAHSLQLSVNKAIDAAGVDGVLKKCRKIVGHFKHSPANSVELEEHQRRLNRKPEVLIQDVATRWNSTLLMIQRIVDNKEPVLATLSDPQHKHSLALPKEADWEKRRILQSLLEPSRYATELLGGERYISCSVILPTFCHLFHAMEPSDDDPAYVVRFKETFVADLQAGKESLNLPWLKVATALDPRFKLLK